MPLTDEASLASALKVSGVKPTDFNNALQNIYKDESSQEKSDSETADGICVVCSDLASGKHYGVFACNGCKGFFRRSVRAERPYVCRGTNDCAVDKLARNACRACRYKRCLEVGMDAGSIRPDRDKTGKRSAPPSHNSSQISLENLDTSSCTLLRSRSGADGRVEPYRSRWIQSLCKDEQEKHLLTRRLSSMNRAKICESHFHPDSFIKIGNVSLLDRATPSPFKMARCVVCLESIPHGYAISLKQKDPLKEEWLNLFSTNEIDKTALRQRVDKYQRPRLCAKHLNPEDVPAYQRPRLCAKHLNPEDVRRVQSAKMVPLPPPPVSYKIQPVRMAAPLPPPVSYKILPVKMDPPPPLRTVPRGRLTLSAPTWAKAMKSLQPVDPLPAHSAKIVARKDVLPAPRLLPPYTPPSWTRAIRSLQPYDPPPVHSDPSLQSVLDKLVPQSSERIEEISSEGDESPVKKAKLEANNGGEGLNGGLLFRTGVTDVNYDLTGCIDTLLKVEQEVRSKSDGDALFSRVSSSSADFTLTEAIAHPTLVSSRFSFTDKSDGGLATPSEITTNFRRLFTDLLDYVNTIRPLADFELDIKAEVIQSIAPAYALYMAASHSVSLNAPPHSIILPEGQSISMNLPTLSTGSDDDDNKSMMIAEMRLQTLKKDVVRSLLSTLRELKLSREEGAVVRALIVLEPTNSSHVFEGIQLKNAKDQIVSALLQSMLDKGWPRFAATVRFSSILMLIATVQRLSASLLGFVQYAKDHGFEVDPVVSRFLLAPL